MGKSEEIGIQISEVEVVMQELMNEYTRVRETDAETIKRVRLIRIQIEIGRNAKKLEKLKG